MIDVHFDEARFRPCARRQRRHRRGRDRADVAGARQRHPQRHRRPADGDSDPARSSDRRAEREGRSMTSASMTVCSRGRIPRRRHRSLRTAAQRRLAGTADRSRAVARHDRRRHGAPMAPRASARSPPSPRSPPTRASRRPIRASRLPRSGSPRRRSVISPRSAAISRSARAAGIFAIRTSPASRRAAAIARPRSGNHLYGVAFDLGPCVAPHPSTMAAALLAYDADDRHRSDEPGFRSAIYWVTAPTAPPITRCSRAK